ncbi:MULTISPECIES: hypothetical protein [Streptomyces]|nr:MULTISPECIES: hypothetical protein [Streptomyces]
MEEVVLRLEELLFPAVADVAVLSARRTGRPRLGAQVSVPVTAAVMASR